MLFFLKLIARLPDSALYFLANILAWILRVVIRYRRTEVNKNIFRAFPEKSALERLVIEKGFYLHIADVAVEILMLSRMSPGQLLKRVEISGLEHLSACVEQKQSMLLLSAHQGNWEWMLTALSVSLPCPLDALYRPLHNAKMEHFFLATRARFGASLIPAEKAARAILKQRKEVRAFGIIGDQNPRRKDDKYWVRFMGIETPVAVGAERIAKLTGYPVFYVATERVARGKYRLVITVLAQAPYAGEGEISQRYMSVVEVQVRNQPESWMWSHHRWRYQREACPQSSLVK